jgi:hypothetical protein
MAIRISMYCYYDDCRYGECHILFCCTDNATRLSVLLPNVLNVIMVSVVMLCFFMLGVTFFIVLQFLIMLGVTFFIAILTFVMLRGVMLKCNYAGCNPFYCYADFLNAEWCYAEICIFIGMPSLILVSGKCHFGECHSGECHGTF